jgi:hypothetical protein
MNALRRTRSITDLRQKLRMCRIKRTNRSNRARHTGVCRAQCASAFPRRRFVVATRRRPSPPRRRHLPPAFVTSVATKQGCSGGSQRKAAVRFFAVTIEHRDCVRFLWPVCRARPIHRQPLAGGDFRPNGTCSRRNRFLANRPVCSLPMATARAPIPQAPNHRLLVS